MRRVARPESPHAGSAQGEFVIGFVRGPGGLVSRLLAEIVPSMVGIVAGGLVLPTLGLPWAIAAVSTGLTILVAVK